MLRHIDLLFALLATSLGTPVDDLKLVFSWVISYPLAMLLKRVPQSLPNIKNTFTICVSLFFLIGLFDLWDGLQTLIVSSAGAYCIARWLRHSPFMPWIGFAFVLGHLSINHIYRQLGTNSGKLDITGAQMVLVMKLSAFCWNLADGRLPEDQLSDFQRRARLQNIPSLFDFAGYVLFFPSLFGGPTFELVEYQRWLDNSLFHGSSKSEASSNSPQQRQNKAPRSGTAAARKAAGGFLWIVLFLPMSGWYDATRLLDPNFVRYSFFRRVWIMHCVGFTARMKYYGAWSLAEGACILTGLGYNGVDPRTGKVLWNRLQNIDPWGVELAQNIRGYLASWNMNTNKWLRNYVYLRVTPAGRKPGFWASLITFTTSAIWHGFHPGYYLTFILASLLQTSAKYFRRNIRPLFLDPPSDSPTAWKRFYDFVSFVATQASMSFAVVPFLLLNFSGSIQAWAYVQYYVIVGVGLSLLFFVSPAKLVLPQTRTFADTDT